MSDKMRQWNNVTDEWLEVDRGGRWNKRTRDRVSVCAGADVHKYIQMLVCMCVYPCHSNIRLIHLCLSF